MLGPQCKIEKGAIVEGAVLWQGVRAGEEAVIRNCIVCSHSYVQEGSHVLDNCVLGESVTVDAGKRLAQGTKVWPDNFEGDLNL